MKSKSLATLTMVLGIALSTSAFAQRHDEKPHGEGKPSTESVDKERVPTGSGRHDEKPHGMKKKPAAKKDAAKAADDKGGK
jgi:hypothetical protein